jgi:hypothetical protein
VVARGWQAGIVLEEIPHAFIAELSRHLCGRVRGTVINYQDFQVRIGLT